MEVEEGLEGLAWEFHGGPSYFKQSHSDGHLNYKFKFTNHLNLSAMLSPWQTIVWDDGVLQELELDNSQADGPAISARG